MKRTITVFLLSLACGLAVHAQQSETKTSTAANNQTSAAANGAGKSFNLAAGTHLAGELQNTIDVRRARVGDQVVLKTTQAIKSGGRTVVSKGSRLMGHISEVAQATKGSGESRIGILFDHLETGSLAVPIFASISSLTSSRANVNASNEGMFASDTNVSGSARAGQSSSGRSGGGLLGGVGGVVSSTTNTVDGVAGGTTAAIGTTVNSTTGAAGSGTSGLGRSLSGIQISQSSNTSVAGSSILSLESGNLRIEKGTNFNLVLTQSASAGTPRDQ